MSQRPAGRLVASMLALSCVAASASAQTLPGSAEREPVIRAGGDVSVVWGPRDIDAFFNYTDYEHNTLRIARVRLAGEWRLTTGLSLLGQVQTENEDSIEAMAAYVRWRPWTTRGLIVQAGRIPPVIGAYARRAYGPDNAVIGSPLAYQYLTSLRPDALPYTMDDVLRMRGRGWQSFFPLGSAAQRPGVPLMSARWDTGIETSWRHDRLELSGAVTMGAPAAPRIQDTNDGRQWSGRAAWHFPSGLTTGFSAARGAWIDRQALGLVDAERRRSAQSLVAADIEYGRGRWLLRGEWMRTVFELPLAMGPVARADLSAGSAYSEIRYRLQPRWQIGLRVEGLTFSRVQGVIDPRMFTWEAPVQRVEAAIGFRVRRTIDIRAAWQQDWRDGGRIRQRGYPAIQTLIWF